MSKTQVISNMLLEMAVPANLLGYDYILKAIELCSEDRSYIRDITKKLYPEIAKCFNTTSSRVERAIRHAVETSFSRLPIDLIEKFFGNSIDPNRGKPTNSEFVSVATARYKFMSMEEGLNNG